MSFFESNLWQSKDWADLCRDGTAIAAGVYNRSWGLLENDNSNPSR